MKMKSRDLATGACDVSSSLPWMSLMLLLLMLPMMMMMMMRDADVDYR